MSDGPEWFAPRRYGYSVGRPITWQGWALTLGFSFVMILLCALFKDRPIQLMAALAPLLIGFAVISARTTRGGWRWRWGDDE